MGRIFVFGSTGMLGGYVSQYLNVQGHDIVNITRQDMDAAKVTYDSLFECFRKFHLVSTDENIVINCVGIIPQSTGVNEASASSRAYFTVNSLFPTMLATVSANLNMRYIHITTDCVFSGKGHNYTEESVHDETNDYGVSKSLGELGINATIIRTSIIGEENKNKHSLLEWTKAQTGKSINGFLNHYWNGVTCLQLAKVVGQIITYNMYWVGVRHVFSPSSVSKYELVSMINEAYSLEIDVKEHNTEVAVDKTLSTVYNTCARFRIPELCDQLRELIRFRG